MLKTRIKRQALQAERAATRLVAIQASVTALGDEDLLDLADIFAGDNQSPLWEIASAEMANRNLKL